MFALKTTNYNHNILKDIFQKARKADEVYAEHTKCESASSSNSGKAYRPILGVTGTLTASPNPCLELERLRSFQKNSSWLQRRRRNAPVSNNARTHVEGTHVEVDLNQGIPPHQVHHHHYGWIAAGNDPKATCFSTSIAPHSGIGLHYSHHVSALHRKIIDCPVPDLSRFKNKKLAFHSVISSSAPWNFTKAGELSGGPSVSTTFPGTESSREFSPNSSITR